MKNLENVIWRFFSYICCIDGLVHNYSIFIANVLEILQSYTKPFICCMIYT